ncbi:MAG: ABC transporter permease, partial [Bacteroidetes bacterium]|nr:ABC transporter permease [Bacteroidota bacterium]MBU1580427.1 ABC transporter permease [Bacteroidota bacterium]
TVLRGSLTSSGKSSHLLRRLLVVFQFAIATMLMIGTFVVHEQLQFLKAKDLGFERENRLVLQLQDTTFRNKLEPFRNAILQNPAISHVSNANGIPGQTTMKLVMQLESEEGWNTQAVMLALTDYDYLNTFGIKLIQGRDFDRNMGTDKQEAAIVNEAFIKQFGWENDPLGKKILIGADSKGEGGRPLKVIGVVADYHFQSLHNPIEPYLITMSENPRHLLTISFQADKSNEVIDFVNQQWDLFASGKPFDYKILDQILAENYEAESRINVIFRISTLFTIFIALIGLLGLSSYVAEQKTKEIGIRKILGASIFNLLRMLFAELGLLIGIAFLIAVPLAWWRIQIWLESSFEYHIDLQPDSFILAGLIAFGAGLLTMSFHLIRVINSNPVEAIKYE